MACHRKLPPHPVKNPQHKESPGWIKRFKETFNWHNKEKKGKKREDAEAEKNLTITKKRKKKKRENGLFPKEMMWK